MLHGIIFLQDTSVESINTLLLSIVVPPFVPKQKTVVTDEAAKKPEAVKVVWLA